MGGGGLGLLKALQGLGLAYFKDSEAGNLNGKALNLGNLRDRASRRVRASKGFTGLHGPRDLRAQRSRA